MHGAVAAVAQEFMKKRIEQRSASAQAKAARPQDEPEEDAEDAQTRTAALINAPVVQRGRKFEVSRFCLYFTCTFNTY
jgi:hypothetical protein